MLVRPVQPSKALPPIIVTPLGNSMLVRPVQPEKALPPIVVTPLGILTLRFLIFLSSVNGSGLAENCVPGTFTSTLSIKVVSTTPFSVTILLV
jgi:hypothetical protein